jgi:hypothetical protein
MCVLRTLLSPLASWPALLADGQVIQHIDVQQ